MSKKSKARLHLDKLHLERIKRTHPNLPYKESFIPSYTGKPERRELRMIEDFCNNMDFCKVNRIDVTGKRIDNRKVVGNGKNYMGAIKMVGSVEWRKSQMQRGIADIVGLIRGRYVAIELKRIYKKGKDRQSEHQKKYQKEVEDAGGIYIICHSFEDFYDNHFWKIYGTQQEELF